ncbi:MAG: DUF5302 domain-containing protein [Propionibacteriaceae bacterium]|nr:DUF5302 domain-containing protein [Propionibacteriaceae bacterium]
MPENQNEDLKAKMREALERKQQGGEGVEESGHHKEKGPAERGRQGGGGMFRRKAGGGS